MLTPEELSQYLTQLRAAFEQDLATWPAAADALLPTFFETEEPTEGDADLLELVANTHLRGEDIQRKYPHFYQRLQSNPALRDAFLETLEMMEDEDE